MWPQLHWNAIRHGFTEACRTQVISWGQDPTVVPTALEGNQARFQKLLELNVISWGQDATMAPTALEGT